MVGPSSPCLLTKGAVMEEEGFICYVPFCRAEPFDTPIELEEHRHAAHPELYEEEE